MSLQQVQSKLVGITLNSLDEMIELLTEQSRIFNEADEIVAATEIHEVSEKIPYLKDMIEGYARTADEDHDPLEAILDIGMDLALLNQSLCSTEAVFERKVDLAMFQFALIRHSSVASKWPTTCHESVCSMTIGMRQLGAVDQVHFQAI